jgi:heat-inducible transcriptional repressor
MLDDRKSAILRAVVQTYIETAQPVGSSHVVAATEIGVSPATVRNDMTLLEREGYLTQPHTSAGRIPTEKGYRFFVDNIGPGELGPAQARQVGAFFAHAHGELEEMLKATSRMLSRVTATTAVVVGETPETDNVRSVQLVGLSPSVFLVVVVMSSGAVLKRTVERSTEVSDDQLQVASQRLAALLTGSSVRSLGAIAVDPGDAVVTSVMSDAIAAIVAAGSDPGRVYVEGASRIADAFDATTSLSDILSLLEQQLSVVALLRDVLDRGLTVAIGSETGVAPLADCSLIVAPYLVGGEPAGTIGVLGPTRMNYQETLAAVAVVSQRLSKLLTEG